VFGRFTDRVWPAVQSLVLACGVRKVWSKLFQGMDNSQQIRKLKEMLTELGMSGRMSLEQAKSIKAKRELAQELGTLLYFRDLHQDPI